MNKKEKRLIEIFEEAANAAKRNEGSVWFFLGYLESKLAREARDGDDEKQTKQRWEVIKEINKITKGLR